MDTKQFNENIEKQFSEWKKKFEEFQVQFSLGKMDAAESFEKQKEVFRNHIVELKNTIDKTTNHAKENVQFVKSKLEELEVQLSLGKADGMDKFIEQKKKIEQAMNAVFESAKKNFDAQFEHVLKMYDSNADAFKTGLEIMKLQFELGKMDSKDKAEEIRKEMNEKLNEINVHFKSFSESGKNIADEWNKLFHENLSLMKTFTENLFVPKK